MFEQFRDFLLYLYSASEKMEEKAAVFGEERKKRMEEFKKQKEELHKKAKEKLENIKAESKEKTQKHINELLQQAGVARAEDIEELKKTIAGLAAKVDKLAK